jgi:hypothetical protein
MCSVPCWAESSAACTRPAANPPLAMHQVPSSSPAPRTPPAAPLGCLQTQQQAVSEAGRPSGGEWRHWSGLCSARPCPPIGPSREFHCGFGLSGRFACHSACATHRKRLGGRTRCMALPLVRGSLLGSRAPPATVTAFSYPCRTLRLLGALEGMRCGNKRQFDRRDSVWRVSANAVGGRP